MEMSSMTAHTRIILNNTVDAQVQNTIELLVALRETDAKLAEARIEFERIQADNRRLNSKSQMAYESLLELVPLSDYRWTPLVEVNNLMDLFHVPTKLLGHPETEQLMRNLIESLGDDGSD